MTMKASRELVWPGVPWAEIAGKPAEKAEAVLWVYTGRRLHGDKVMEQFVDLDEAGLANPSVHTYEADKWSKDLSIGVIYGCATNDGSMWTTGSIAPRWLGQWTLSDRHLSSVMLDVGADKVQGTAVLMVSEAERRAKIMEWAAHDRVVGVHVGMKKLKAKADKDHNLMEMLAPLRKVYQETPAFRRASFLAAIMTAIVGG